ncbi:hypothetical protein ACFL7D_02500 [candidate division KSB1 bacterium]
MKTIWYFIGLVLLIMGGIVLLTGFYLLISPPDTKTVLAETNPNIWWGAFMLLTGLIFFVKNRKATVD